MFNRQSSPISTPLEPCRIAPYVNFATIRSVSNTGGSNVLTNFQHTSKSFKNKNDDISSSLPFLRQICRNPTISAFDSAIISAAAHKYAVMGSGNAETNIFTVKKYPLNLSAIAAAQCKNSSIADLRMKAKRHTESLGLGADNKD